MILTYEIAANGPASIANDKARWQKGQRYTTQDPDVIDYVEANPQVFKVIRKVVDHAPAPAPAAEKPKAVAEPVTEKALEPEAAKAPESEPAPKAEKPKAKKKAEKPKAKKKSKPKAEKPKAEGK